MNAEIKFSTDTVLLLRFFFTLLILFSYCTHTNAMNSQIDIHIKVKGEKGSPLSYASVWMTEDYGKFQFTSDDLKRVVNRYYKSHELIMGLSHPLKNILSIQSTNEQGETYFSSTLSRQFGADYEARYGVPNKIKLSMAVLKRGYLPEIIEFEWSSEQTEFYKELVLRRDTNIERKSYYEELEKLIYFASQFYSGTPEVDTNLVAKLDSKRNEAEELYNKVIEIGDKDYAAIVSYVKGHMPIAVRNENASGRVSTKFSRWGVTEDTGDLDVVRAYEINVGEPNLIFKKIHRKYSTEANLFKAGADLKTYESFLSEIEPIILKHKDEVWPQIQYVAFLAHAKSKNYKKACDKARELFKHEPKYKTLEKMYKRIGAISKANGELYSCE